MRAQALVAALALLAAPAACEDLTFEQALDRTLGRNEAVLAARREEGQREQEQGAARALRWPRIEGAARLVRLDDPIVLDLEPVRQVILGLHPQVPAAVVPPFREVVQDEEYWKAELRLTWPLFTGGRIDARNHAADSLLDDARAQTLGVRASLTSELASRYYGARLARAVRDVRAQVRDGLEEHRRRARRLEEEGQLARVERLHAEVAFTEADQRLRAAEHDVALAGTALLATLATEDPVDPVSPLVLPEDPGPLAALVAGAREHSPLLGRLAAQAEAARQAARAARGERLPEVFAFGQRELHEADLTILEPRWAVGAGVRVTLFDGGEKARLEGAARARAERVELLQGKARRDLGALVERHHRELAKARELALSLQDSRELASEGLRARIRAFEEGVGTSLEVVDARLALARVDVERAQAAHAAIVALAQLLEACGEPERLPGLLARGTEVTP